VLEEAAAMLLARHDVPTTRLEAFEHDGYRAHIHMAAMDLEQGGLRGSLEACCLCVYLLLLLLSML